MPSVRLARRARAALAVLALVLAAPATALAQYADPDFWHADERIEAMLVSGNTLYLGGRFAHLWPRVGTFAILDPVTGAGRPNRTLVDGIVNAVAADGAGGWFIGGGFTTVAGVARSGLAHIRPDGAVDAWSMPANNGVNALLVHGNTLYVGGNFTTLGGQTRRGVGAVDLSTGALAAWNPDVPGIVYALAASGTNVFLGGYLNSVGGQSRPYLAAADSASGAPSAWNPGVDNPVTVLAVNGGVLYAAGAFTSIGGAARTRLAAFDLGTGLVTAWNPAPDAPIYALATSGGRVIAGGGFTAIGGASRRGLAALDAATGSALAWNAAADGDVTALLVAEPLVYASGTFGAIGGQARRGLAAVSTSTALATSFVSEMDGVARGLALAGGTLVAGGTFTHAGGVARAAAAAIDLESGAPTRWNPGVDGEVRALATLGATIYLAGDFAHVGGQPRAGAAAVSAAGVLQGWDPAAAGVVPYVYAIAAAGTTVYAAGPFTGIGGQVRGGLAALDATTGGASGWNPSPDGTGSSVAVGPFVYVGGGFSHIAGQWACREAIDPTTGGVPGPWLDDTTGVHSRVLYANGLVYGDGSDARDASTGTLTAWNALPGGGGVQAIAADGALVYLGGTFTSLSGQARSALGAVDAFTGAPSAWNPGAQGANGRFPWVSAFAFANGAVCVGGYFDSLAHAPSPFLARVLPADATAPTVTVLSPNGGETIAIGSHHLVRWTSSDATRVRGVGVLLSRNGPSGPFSLLASGLPASGACDWLVTGSPTSTAWIRVVAADAAGNAGLDLSDAAFTLANAPAGVAAPEMPALALARVAPDPVRATATVAYTLARPGVATVDLLDVQGREVARLASGPHAAGRHTADLDARGLRAGLYFVRLSAAGGSRSQRVAVIH